MKTVLISGASIAGPVLAWWLRSYGFTPVLVERMAGPAQGGHAIDVRGPALDVLRAMGLVETVREKRMQMKGVSVIDDDGRETWRSEEMTISGGRFDNDDIEILRDRLSRILVGGLPPEVEIIYGDSIAALHEAVDDVEVIFASGEKRRFDLVVGADGLRSNVRRKVFGEDRIFMHSFDIALAPFSAPNILGLKDWQISFKGKSGGYMVYTTPENDALRVCFNVPSNIDADYGGRAEQMAHIREHCGGLGWETPNFLDAMDKAPDFYLGLIAQIRMPQWTKGRIALVGDAGYCPSPYTGQGTSLAIIGAYVLAYELAKSPRDHEAAFARYEAKLRPFVLENQAIAQLTLDERFESDPEYYGNVVEPVMQKAKNAISLEGLSKPQYSNALHPN
jgi:2-polyprenyl-6-methoxyphenol hydroxylase-like FAD-dependent oxidoreductase